MSGYTSISDMFDGGGPGQSGDTFEGALGGVSNGLGLSPSGSGGNGGNSGGGNQIGGQIGQRAGAMLGGLTGNPVIAMAGSIIGGLVGSGRLNLGSSTVSRMQERGVIGDDAVSAFGENRPGQGGTISGDNDMDGVINQILDNESLTQEQMQAAIAQALADAGVTGDQNAPQMNAQGIQTMANEVYGSNQGMDLASMTPEQIIRRIYQDETGRDADEGGLQNYLSEYQNGNLTLTQIANQISSSEEGMNFDPSGAIAFDPNTPAGNNPTGVMNDPSRVAGDNRVSDLMTLINPDAQGTSIDPSNPAYALGDVSIDPATGQTMGVGNVTPQQAQGYTAATSYDAVVNAQGTAAQGTVRDEALVNVDDVRADMQGAATGVSADGSRNYLGEALNDYARQGIGSVIDTSTAAGRILAQELGEGNYVDAKATMKGQLDILSKEFVGPNGEPKIPSWAAGTARAVSKIAAFSGMTGTAATAAMATALMEASLPIAQADSQFFQTVTLQNLSNKQQMTINKANVLANLNLADMDARMNAAVTNAQTFLQMDLANLDNQQQMAVVNTQSRVQSLLEDARAVNAARMFTADAQNDFTKFYDQLNTNIDMFVAEQSNAMSRFNAGEINDAREFNASMTRQRDIFESDMAYNIDLANARWRQTVETTNSDFSFRAAQTDVQNLINISTESMNRMWDREDAILAYTWKSAESELDRDTQRYAADRNYDLREREIDNAEDAAEGAGWFELIKFGTDLVFGDDFSIF